MPRFKPSFQFIHFLQIYFLKQTDAKGDVCLRVGEANFPLKISFFTGSAQFFDIWGEMGCVLGL